MAELDQPSPLAKPQHLAEKPRQRVQMTLAELRDRAEVRRVETDDAHEVDAFPAGFGDPPRRVDPVAIAVEQKRRHHRRIERRLPAIDTIGPLDLLQVDLLDHQVQDEPREMTLVDKLLNRRRQQQRFIDLPRAVALAHTQAESDSSTPRQQNPRFLRQAPRGNDCLPAHLRHSRSRSATAPLLKGFGRRPFRTVVRDAGAGV